MNHGAGQISQTPELTSIVTDFKCIDRVLKDNLDRLSTTIQKLNGLI
jgi:hypothetical protein